MSEDQLVTVAVGEPAPFIVPDREGCMMEIGYPTPGMNILVQYPKLSPKELETLHSPLIGYSYYETETIVPIAYWIFKFPHGMFVETNFNACLGFKNKSYLSNIKEYLKTVSNRLSFFFLDRNIVKGMRVIGLHPESIVLFHNTLKTQLAKKFSENDFIITMKQLENNLSSQELYDMGTVFTFSK